MDGDVETQLLDDFPENQTPRCHGLGVPEMVNWMLRLLLRLMLKLIFSKAYKYYWGSYNKEYIGDIL